MVEKRTGHQTFLFHRHQPSVVTNPGIEALNINNLSVIACHNTKQRRALLADSKGYWLKTKQNKEESFICFLPRGCQWVLVVHFSMSPYTLNILYVFPYLQILHEWLHGKKQKETERYTCDSRLVCQQDCPVSVVSHLELEAALKLWNPILSHNQHGFPFILSSN